MRPNPPKRNLISKLFQQQRYSGRDSGAEDREAGSGHKDVLDACHPWLLDLGNPCRDDDFWLS
ncbi:hypothetical protein [Methylicorpusculum sp.]|uniref:hypothetical protein n=1 Tax=Methylicorpusculum sp. TaxID=2713644 RepID=UPI0027309BE9|nr:hypothetical protein [Methylicorpusculum sp.]